MCEKQCSVDVTGDLINVYSSCLAATVIYCDNGRSQCFQQSQVHTGGSSGVQGHGVLQAGTGGKRLLVFISTGSETAVTVQPLDR